VDTHWPSIGDPAPSPVASPRHTRNFFFIVCGIAAFGTLQSRHPLTAPNTSRIPFYLSIGALQLLFLWFVRKGVRSRERSVLDLVGRNSSALSAIFMDLLLAIGFAMVLRSCAMIIQQLLGLSVGRPVFLLPVGPGESVLWILVSIVAGCCEEIVFRGYLQRQIWAITGSLTLALMLQAIVFAFAHAYQGWFAAVLTGVYGVAFGMLAAWRRTIRPGIFAHCLIDIIGGLARR
jgi:CAAX protease family protein